MRSLCLLTAGLMSAGCACSPTPSTLPSKPPPLDSTLAVSCEVPDVPVAADYDAWQAWVMGPVLGALGDCAARHRKTVGAWPR